MGLLTKKNILFVVILVILPCLSHAQEETEASKTPAIRPFYSSSTSDYRISTYTANVYDAFDDCKNLMNAGRTFHLLIIETEAEDTEIVSQLRKFNISSVWTAGEKSDHNAIPTWKSDDSSKSFMKFQRLSDSNETISFHPRKRRSPVNADNRPYGMKKEAEVSDKAITPKCRRIAPEKCKPPKCTVTLSDCNIITPNCTATSKPECSAVRPDCSARCENCTITVPPQCYVQSKNCTVKTPKNCRVIESTECTVVTPPCTVTRPPCPPPDALDCFHVTAPAPCTTRQPCIRNDSCIGDDCKCPIQICQVNATICPQPEAHCPAPIVSCPDPKIECVGKPKVECDPPEVDCPKPTVVCTEAQVSCSSPIVNCPAVITTCLPPNVTCPPPDLQCPPPKVECEKPDGDCENVSTPEPCPLDESTTTTERPCPHCTCMVMKKSENYRWIFEKCMTKHRFVCESPKKI